MSSPSDCFECRWQPSRVLLAACTSAYVLALIASLLLDIPVLWKLAAVLACLAHGAWVLPRSVLLSHRDAVRGLRRSRRGWQLWSRHYGWHAVQLRPDSVALPNLVILRFRLPGQWLSRSACIPADALPAEQHRRLRVRLKFSRRRWAPVPE